MKYFSKSNRGFYDSNIHQSLPGDAVEISNVDHMLLMDAQAAGQVIDWSGDTPAAVDWAAPILTLAESQDTRRDELRADCTAAIVGLFSSSALGSAHTYDCRIEDQANIRMRQAASTIDAAPRNIWAHDGVEFTREPHVTAALDQVVLDMEAHIETQQAKLAGLIATVNAVDTGDDEADAATIAAIVW